MSEPTETELKLTLSETALHRLRDSEILCAATVGHPKRAHIVTTYWDTPDHALARRGLSLRVRAQDGERLQTIKAPNGGGAEMQRREWEQPIASDKPDLKLAAGTPVEAFAGADFSPILTTDVTRTTRSMALSGAEIEADLDEGEIRAGERREPIRELELELRKGSLAALYRLALSLHREAPIGIETESKAARGMRLLEGKPATASKADPQGLQRGMTGAEAFRRIIGEALHHLLANVAPVRAGEDEGVHQLRVALTRLRAALRMFKPVLSQRVVERFERELRGLGRRVGAARDWSVFCDDQLPEVIDEREPREASHSIADAAQTQRAEAFARAEEAVTEPHFTLLALSLAKWAQDIGRRRRDPALDLPIERLAPRLIRELLRNARKRWREAQSGEPAAVHGLRKALKRLRYGLEFLAGVDDVPAEDGRRIRKVLDRLGAFNDAATAARLAETLSQRSHEFAPVAAALALRRDRQRHDALPRIERRARKTLRKLER